MEYHYLIICSTKVLKQKSYPTYGIAAVIRQEGCTCIKQIFWDVCTDFRKVEKLAQTCNDLMLDPLHLSDVIYDFLS